MVCYPVRASLSDLRSSMFQEGGTYLPTEPPNSLSRGSLRALDRINIGTLSHNPSALKLGKYGITVNAYALWAWQGLFLYVSFVFMQFSYLSKMRWAVLQWTSSTTIT